MIYKYFLIIVLFSCNLFSTESVDSLFQESNKLYQLGDYEKALNVYLSLVNDVSPNSNLDYNIGNCYFKLNNLGYARFYFERAKIHNPHDSDILHNLQIVESRLIDDIKPLKDFFITRYIRSISNYFSLFVWSIIILCLLYVICFLIWFVLFGSSFKVKKTSLNALFFIIPILLFSSFFMLKNISESKLLYGILTSSNCYVKTAPTENSDNQFIIHEGIKFQVIDSLDDWSRILLVDGNDGWIANHNFLELHK